MTGLGWILHEDVLLPLNKKQTTVTSQLSGLQLQLNIAVIASNSFQTLFT